MIPKRYLISLPVLVFLIAFAPLRAQEESADDNGATTAMPAPPKLPPNLKPPSTRPPGPPPELPEFLKNRRSATARPATPVEEAAGQQPGETAVVEEAAAVSVDGDAETIDFQLKDESVESTLELLEQLTNRSVLRPQNLPEAKLNFNSRGPIPKTDAVAALKSLLSLNGINIAESGRFLQASASESEPAVSVPPPQPEEIVGQINLKDETALQVIDLIEQMTGKPVLRMQSIPAVKLNFDSQGPMTKKEALIALESLLSINGIALTELGDKFLKAVPIANTPQQVPMFLSGSALALPPSQAYYTKLYNLDYLSTTEAQPVIQPLMSVNTGGSLVPFPKHNSLLITDALVNLQRIEQVLSEADQPQENPVDIRFFQLENVKARDLQARMQALINNQASALYKYTINNTIIEADERSNQLILMTHPSNIEMLSNIIEKLDINVAPTTNSRVYYIKHAKAVDIDALLEEIITGQQQVAEEEGSNTRRARPVNQQQPNQQAQVVTTGIDTSGLRFSEYITIVADERSNAIVAYGTKQDLDQIAKIIEEIDVLLAQVHIQVIIAEVSLSDDEMSGISALSLEYNPLEGPAGFSVGAEGPAFDFFGAVNTDTLELSLQNAVQNRKASILSAPIIVTTHNQEATVDVVQSRPFITGSVTSGDGLGGVTQSVDYRDVGIQLTVTPLIGSNGIVQMEINQKVENFTTGFVIVNGVQQPFIDKREATSFVSVTDKQTIVLAGLQQSDISGTDSGIWLLKDIPIIGDLFTSNTSTDNRRELMMFITPNVIYSQSDATKGVDSALETLDNGEDTRFFMETQNMSAVYERGEEAQEKEDTWPVPRRGPRN